VLLDSSLYILSAVLGLVNGTSTWFFSSSHGLRQRDPLSSLLFVMVMEALGRMILVTVSGGLLSDFSLWDKDSYFPSFVC
jgi:hypothetical protein